MVVLVAVIVTCGGLGIVEGGRYCPELLIVPTVEFPPRIPPALQVTPLLVRFWVLPSVNVPVAVNCCTVPSATEVLLGVTAIEVNAAAVTVRLSVPVIDPKVAEIVTDPCTTPFAKPMLLTVAVAGLEELQVTKFVRFCVEPSA